MRAGLLGAIDVLSYGVLAILVVLACCWLPVVARRNPHASGDPEVAAELEALAGRRDRRIAVAVIEGKGAAGARCAFLRAGAGSRFEIGSLTKALTGMLLACAIDRGEMSMDTTVGDLCPDLNGYELGSVTVGQLCTHCSGLPRLPRSPVLLARVLLFGLLGVDPYRGTTPARVLRLAARQRLRRAGRYHYSNLGAALLGQLLAVAAGTTYAALLNERLLTPLGMTDTHSATRHSDIRPGWSALGLPRMTWVPDGYAPAGGVVGTVGDLSRLATALLDGTAPGLASTRPVPGVDTGVGSRETGMFWLIDRVPGTERTMIWHSGATGGYSAVLALYPQAGRAVIVLANTSRVRAQQAIAVGLARWLARAEPGHNHDEADIRDRPSSAGPVP